MPIFNPPLWSRLVEEYRDARIDFPALKAVSLAQWAVESARGTSALAREYINFGGIKYRDRMEGYATPVEYRAHDGVALYCRFEDLAAFIDGYWHFISSGPYEGWDAFGDDPNGYLDHIAGKGYAADQRYFDKVRALIPEAEASLKSVADPAIAGTATRRFNDYILRSVGMIEEGRSGGGYDINSYFTQNLTYGPDCCVKANHPPLTMCVAAVSEIIIEALNLYRADTGDDRPFRALPIQSWKGGTKKDIRAHIFQYAGTGCHGTAHALSRFGVGEECSFENLEPGDFVTMNRTGGSGHTAVFMGYIDEGYATLPAYSAQAIGFRYFSAQGKGRRDAGFAHRWAFFTPKSPPAPADKVRDTGIIRSSKQSLLNTGFMRHPEVWSIQGAIAALREEVKAELYATLTGRAWEGEAQDGPAIAGSEALEDAVERELERELPPDLTRFDGVTRE